MVLPSLNRKIAGTSFMEDVYKRQGLHAYFCRTAYNMGIDLFAYNDNIILDLCEYTAKYNFCLLYTSK